MAIQQGAGIHLPTLATSPESVVLCRVALRCLCCVALRCVVLFCCVVLCCVAFCSVRYVVLKTEVIGLSVWPSDLSISSNVPKNIASHADFLRLVTRSSPRTTFMGKNA